VLNRSVVVVLAVASLHLAALVAGARGGEPSTAARDLAHAKKAQQLKELDLKTKASLAPLVGEAHVAMWKERLANVPPTAPAQAVNVRVNLADQQLIMGQIPESIETLQGCFELFKKFPVDNKTIAPVLRKLAVAFMRLGERNNCVGHHNSESCVFPLSPAAVHVEPEGAQNAQRVLIQLLDAVPGDAVGVWLLNITHMQLGTYPKDVPHEWLIPPSSFASEYDIGRFKNVSEKLGVNIFNRAGGAWMDDFDGDGNLDIVMSSSGTEDPMHMFHNNGDGTFKDITKQAQLDGQLGGLNLTVADYDNDGRLDILVLRGGWMAAFGDHPNSLLKQIEDGSFRDVTEEAGILIYGPTQNASWADIDNDGDLDLFIGYESVRGPSGTQFPSHLFRNRGNGTFEDVTAKAGVGANGVAKGSAFGDYDGDGLPDLYVSTMGSPNRLYHNNGDGTFTDVADKLGVTDPLYSFSSWFFDYNNDGWLDILATYYGQSDRTGEVEAYYKNHTTGFDTVRLYENDGKGGFKDVTRERKLNRVMFPMGTNFGDLDNDGYPDMYFTTGDPDFSSLWPDIMLRNDRGRAFQDVTTAGGFGLLQKGHSVCFGDLDNDGDQDIFTVVGGAVKDDGFWDALFENPGHGNHWLTVRLTGVKTNKFAIGARVRANITEPEGTRDVYGFVGSNSSFGGNSYQQELGLGKAQKINFLEVFWPTTGKTQRFENVPLDRFLHVTEDKDKFDVEDRRKITF
jgi:FG-GAP-like repeat/ASPIC and UnbV